MAQAKRGLGKGLGRGLGALFGEDVVEGVVLDKRGSHSHESADGEGEKISRGRKRASASDVKSSEKNQASSEDKGAGKKETGVKNSRNQSLSGEAEKTESDKQANVSREHYLRFLQTPFRGQMLLQKIRQSRNRFPHLKRRKRLRGKSM